VVLRTDLGAGLKNLFLARPSLDLSITSDLELGHIIALSLDDEPLATSRRILLQIMSEETNHQTEPVGAVSNPGRSMANHREKYFCA